MRRLFRVRASKKEDSQEEAESPKEKLVNRSSRRQIATLAKANIVENGVVEKEREKLKSKSRRNGVTYYGVVHGDKERKRETQQDQVEPDPWLSNPPKHLEWEQVAAGWPAWLCAEAGEALKGWIPRRADSFEKIDKIGQGTYSNVYKARDLDTGRVVALKKVRFDNMEPESVRFMSREIQILRHLNHPNVIKLEGLVTSRMSCSLYLVFEYMEHDLAGLAACPGISFSESQVKCYMLQILRGLDHCHSRRVLHRDIKGSNLLLDSGGMLKMADFGLATILHPDQKHALTSRVVTLWYRPPELLLGATDYGVGIDLWSVGCILAELLAGKPIMPGRTEVEQLHKIFKLCGSPSEEYWRKSKLPHATIFKPQQPYKRCIAETFKDFSPSALALLEILLAIEPMDRGTAAAALKSEFFTTKPLACDPSSLPKYPPTKKSDARIQDEDTRRERTAGGKIHGHEAARKVDSRERSSRGVPVPEANAELAASLQKCRTTAASKRSEKWNPQQDDPTAGFSIDPPRHVEGGNGGRIVPPVPAGTHSGPRPSSINITASWGSYEIAEDRVLAFSGNISQANSKTVLDLKPQSGHGMKYDSSLSSLSALVAARNNTSEEARNAPRQERVYGAEGSQNSRHGNLTKYSKQERAEILQIDALSRGSDGFHLQETMYHQRPPSTRFGGRPEHIHSSGPLLPPSENLDNILGEHERQIQQAVRRVRHDRDKIGHNPRQNGVASKFGNSFGPTSGHMKTAKAHFTGEIIELQEPRPGLSSVSEHLDEQTAFVHVDFCGIQPQPSMVEAGVGPKEQHNDDIASTV